MIKKISLLASLFICLAFVCNIKAQQKENNRVKILVETNKGKFTIELYNETPLHKQNFINLVSSHAYDGVIFHRVIKDFMVQGGNLMTKHATAKTDVTQDTLKRTVPAEIMTDQIFHVRGSLCAAREPDESNPEKASSGSQFYIVTGKYYTAFDLSELEAKKHIKFSDKQKEAYMHEGGTPSLDGGYTVFGRVIDGWNVIDKIQRVETDGIDRPIKDVIIKSMHIIAPK
ncbi:peptidylprolyl isomerase [Porphyromonas pogonae]|uniref:peptidylprolyl isomerase n=1 Tax=Porphyromonas pogonae TaxID=867595 RepID=UPI002E79BC65|nr:peptidylprolyl isomerase [Porphyromonas pogonae]